MVTHLLPCEIILEPSEASLPALNCGPLNRLFNITILLAINTGMLKLKVALPTFLDCSSIFDSSSAVIGVPSASSLSSSFTLKDSEAISASIRDSPVALFASLSKLIPVLPNLFASPAVLAISDILSRFLAACVNVLHTL